MLPYFNYQLPTLHPTNQEHEEPITHEHTTMESREGRETGDRKRPAPRLRVGGDGGGGVRIEGVLVWGGTLAIASLMALFTIRAKKRDSSRLPRGPEKLKVKPTEEGGGEGDENGGLRVVLQDQSSPTGPLTPRNSSCCIGGSYGGSSTPDLAHLDCCDSASGRSSTSEEKPAPVETDEEKEPHQETVFSGGEKTESAASFSDYSVVEDGSPPPATQDPTLATDDWDEETETHLQNQIIYGSREVDALDHVADEELMAEADESTDSVEEEEEDGSGGSDDEQAEEVEGSSEESGGSCPELNAGAIWPLEMIDEAVETTIEDRTDLTKINKPKNDSIIHEEREEDDVGDDTSENPGGLTALPEKGLGLLEPVAGNHWTTSLPRPPIWIWCVLLLLILLSFQVHSSSIRNFVIDRRDFAVK